MFVIRNIQNNVVYRASSQVLGNAKRHTTTEQTTKSLVTQNATLLPSMQPSPG